MSSLNLNCNLHPAYKYVLQGHRAEGWVGQEGGARRRQRPQGRGAGEEDCQDEGDHVAGKQASLEWCIVDAELRIV